MCNEHLFSCKHSENLWKKRIQSFGLESVLRWYGEGKYKTAICYLIQNGAHVAKGIGKGLTKDQVEMSACYEALENYLSCYHLFQREIKLENLNNIRKEYQTTAFRFQSTFFDKKNNQILPWIIATEFQKNQPYAIPLAAVDPSYYTHLLPEDNINYYQDSFYASTNGLACAATYQEALIHAISEIIERDAISYFLLDTFLLNEPIQIIKKISLPEYLQTLIYQLETQYKDEIMLINLPSRYNVPTFAAFFTRQETKIPPKGFGASLNASYAAERAILEALQTKHVYECFPEECINLTITKMRDFPVLFNCLRFNLMELIDKNKCKFIDFHISQYSLTNMSIVNYLQVLIDKIYEKHSLMLIDKILVIKNGFSCLNVIIPGMEEFFHIFNNEIIIPQDHTSNYVKHKQEIRAMEPTLVK